MVFRETEQDTRNDIWLILFLLLGTLVLWSTVVQQTTFGKIYNILFFFTLAMYLLSRASPNFAEFQNIRHKGISLQIITGFVLGFALVGTLYGTYALLSPLSVPNIKFTSPLGILGFESISQVFLMSVVVAEIEESFRSSTLRPTIAEWLSNHYARTLFMLVTALIIYMVLLPIRLLGAALFVVAAVDSIGKFNWIDRLFKHGFARQATAIIVAAAFFAVLHLRAYGGTSGVETATTVAMLLNAFLFAVIADTINSRFKSTTPSKIAHCFNNSSISSVSIGLPAFYGAFITTIYAIVLFVMSRGTMDDLKPSNIIASIGGV